MPSNPAALPATTKQLPHFLVSSAKGGTSENISDRGAGSSSSSSCWGSQRGLVLPRGRTMTLFQLWVTLRLVTWADEKHSFSQRATPSVLAPRHSHFPANKTEQNKSPHLTPNPRTSKSSAWICNFTSEWVRNMCFSFP